MMMPVQAQPVSRKVSTAARRGVSPAGFFDDFLGGFSSVIKPVAGVLGPVGCIAACNGNPACVAACNAGVGGLAGLLP